MISKYKRHWSIKEHLRRFVIVIDVIGSHGNYIERNIYEYK